MDEPFNGKKLFTVGVEITHEMIVLAEDEEEAEMIAKESFDPWEIDKDSAWFDVSETYGIPAGWIGAIPFGSQDKHTCEQIQAAWNEYETMRPPTLAELEAAGQQRLL